jgi:8-oxo-dGTP pyrophosphatase MutT (NUDIX family)
MSKNGTFMCYEEAVYPTPRDAATVILLRAGRAPFEVFLLRRHRGSGFMANAYVFPGGAAEPGEEPRATAAREMSEEAGVAIADLDAFHYFSHWITPSVEKKRFSARFYVAVLPAGQEPHFDGHETVDQAWVTPAEALEKSGELALPPPQIRTFH